MHSEQAFVFDKSTYKLIMNKSLIVLVIVLVFAGAVDFSRAEISERIDGCLKEIETKLKAIQVAHEVESLLGSTTRYWALGLKMSYFPNVKYDRKCRQFHEDVEEIIRKGSSCRSQLTIVLNPKITGYDEIEQKYPDIVRFQHLSMNCLRLMELDSQ